MYDNLTFEERCDKAYEIALRGFRRRIKEGDDDKKAITLD